jgi:hypothetical protein
MVVGVCRLSLFFHGSRSLKDKRQGLRRILDRLRAKFNAACAEVRFQDSWQRADLGVAVVSNEGEHARAMLDSITSFVDQLYVAEILDRQVEILHYGEHERLGGGET